MPPIPRILLSCCALISLGPPLAAQIYVDDDATGANDGSSWQDAFTDLQDALAVAAAADEIWLAEGTYRPSTTGDRTRSFDLSVGASVHGGFVGSENSLDSRLGSAAATLLSGDLNGDDGPGFTNRSDNSLHVVFVNYFASGRLERVTVRGGQADQPGDELGGGLYSPAGPTELAVDCIFRDNYAEEGGGVCTSGLPSIYGCTFIGNRALKRAGGLFIPSVQSATPHVERCRFLGNEVLGAGGAGEGGGIWGGWGLLLFCEFSGNRAPTAGAGLWTGEAWGLTVHGNTATQSTGGIVLSYSTLRGSILWGNADPSGFTEGAQVSGLVGEVNESCIQGWTGALGGARNLSADPLFLNPRGADGLAGTEDDDLALRRGSPCIDRGEPLGWSGPQVDVRGLPRLVDSLDCGDGGVIDMGAIERQQIDGTSNYCTAAPSSLGVPARITSPCTLSLFQSPFLDLVVRPVPDGFGAFLASPDPSRAPAGDGLLCLGASPARLAVARAVAGTLSVHLDLTRQPAATLLLPGSTWFIQAVYRDRVGGSAGFNFSDAASLEIRD